ncbi:MAG TPA: HU family DNA-binding protein [Spirochaetota bacterium]|nr:HU family DNA-binding protein [Spirochaetota bacterium]HQQ51719.1 HU family DNA-binding protein [Spirochaetota bacterium]
MTKHEIITRLHIKHEIPRDVVQQIVDGFVEEIVQSVQNGEKVTIKGFGVFTRIRKAERKVFSPIAQREVIVPSKYVIDFKSSKNTAIE